MKPYELYTGPAPAAMSQMGQGLSEAGANIGRSLQQGYQALGQGLASGIQGAAGAYKEYQSAKTANDITRSMLKDPQYASILGLPDPNQNPDAYKETQGKMLSSLDDIIKSHGQIGGAQFSKQYLSPIQEYAQLGRQYAQQLKLADIQAETARLVGLTSNIAPYRLGQKGAQNYRPESFLHPDFGGQKSPAPVTPDQAASAVPDATQDYILFLKQNPNGTLQDFSSWKQEQDIIRKYRPATGGFDPTGIILDHTPKTR